MRPGLGKSCRKTKNELRKEVPLETLTGERSMVQFAAARSCGGGKEEGTGDGKEMILQAQPVRGNEYHTTDLYWKIRR